jgi:predicted nuclease of predicted toxin-antitoxin system
MTLKFVADESCPGPIVAALRDAGYDVASVQEAAPGSFDEDILRRSVEDGRIVITQDRDFGELVMRGAAQAVGVIYLRMPLGGRDWSAACARVLEAMSRVGDQAKGAISVVGWSAVRIRRF